MRDRPGDEPRREPTRSRSYTVTTKPSSRSARAAERPMTPAPTTAAESGSRCHHLAELARLVELADDVAAADELAVDEELGDRRPAGPGREAAAREVRGALHEQHDPVALDRFCDLLADLVFGDDHLASVVICNAW